MSSESSTQEERNKPSPADLASDFALLGHTPEYAQEWMRGRGWDEKTVIEPVVEAMGGKYTEPQPSPKKETTNSPSTGANMSMSTRIKHWYTMQSRNYSTLEKVILRALLLVLVLFALSLTLDIAWKVSRLMDPPRKGPYYRGLPGPPGPPWLE